jgi:hypothetical protein
MAGNSITARRVASATLQASTVDLVYLTEGGFAVTVTNDSGTAPIYWTVDHPGGVCTAPTVAASTGTVGLWCSAASPGAQSTARHSGQFGSIVQLISSGTPSYTVNVSGNQVSA